MTKTAIQLDENELEKLNDLQLRAHINALYVDAFRKSEQIKETDKKLGEYKLSAETLSRTVNQQSEALTNREKIVEELTQELKAVKEGPLKGQDQLIKELQTKLDNPLEPDPDIFLIKDLGDAIIKYGVNCASVSQTVEHNAIAVTFIQVGKYIYNLPDIYAAVEWLNGNQTKSLSS